MSVLCEIVTPRKVVFSDNVDMVILPGIDGTMAILPNHAPVLSMLKDDVLTIKMGDRILHYTVFKGLAEIQPDQITILADDSENVTEINVTEAKDLLDEKRRQLVQGQTDRANMDFASHQEDIQALRAEIANIELQLSTAKKYQ